MCPSPVSKAWQFGARPGERSIALISTLALLVIVSILIVAFVTMMRLDRSATASYSQSVKADQLARGGLRLVIGQLQAEMAKDAPADSTYPSNPLYTNVTSANIMPQSVGTNSAMPDLIKISTTTPSYTGTLTTGLTASSISSTTPSANGRLVSTNIWNQAYLGTYPNNASTPNWVIMTRGGPSSGTGLPFGQGTANSVNNSTQGNNNYVVGRIAYAIYDESGLLDVNVAGYPTNGTSGSPPGGSLSAAQIQAIKGTLAGADVTTMGLDPNALTAWRNAATSASPATYTNYVSSFLSTNAPNTVYPGDTTFLSRQDLIQAAQNGTAGLTTAMLPNLTTFTRERNAPSWGPSQNATDMGAANNGTGNIYAYKSNAMTSSSTNAFIPYFRRTASGTITGYRIDGTPYTYSVAAGDPVVYRRFPLDRLNWLGPNGINTAAFNNSLTPAQQAAAVQACFGLAWGASTATTAPSQPSGYNLWQYVGSISGTTTEQSSIKTLNQISLESTPREPNFFELLQAGILTGSLGMDGQISFTGTPAAKYAGFAFDTYSQSQKILQVFRIGANIISQYDSSNVPALIEYNQSYTPPSNASTLGLPTTAWTTPWQACGVVDLPYLTMFHILAGADTGTSEAPYMMIGMWNPHQGTPPSGSPKVRVHIIGSVGLGNPYGTSYSLSNTPLSPVAFNYGGAPTISGYAPVLNASGTLSTAAGSGEFGFTDPHVPLAATDFKTVISLGSSNANGLTFGRVTIQGTNYAGFRLPDFNISTTTTASGTPAGAQFTWSWLIYDFQPNTLNPFNVMLEYYDGTNWVPYNYFAGINDYQHTWFTKNAGVYGEYMGPGWNSTSSTGTLVQVQAIDPPPSGVSSLYYDKYPAELCSDPRSIRFSYSEDETPNSTGTAGWCTYLNSSMWSSTTGNGTGWSTYGRTPAQNTQYLFSNATTLTGTYVGPGAWAPAALSRNNNTYQQNLVTPVSGVYASYNDPDGVLRIADSGLFPVFKSTDSTTYPSTSNTYGWEGDPFALSTTRTADRPIFLNRPFYSVGELGYVSRDDPWRTLDFFTQYSADAALLDLFTVNRSDNAVVAGRINLNSRNQAALKAVLNNTISDVVSTTLPPASTPNLSNPTQIATDLVTLTGTTALTGRDQIATKFLPTLTTTSTASNADFTLSGNIRDEGCVKYRREAVSRALADVGQTRTWNLMIDIVAQAGRYPPTATALDQFVVEGERHYWLHVAIDRFTGKVIDQQLEAVTQ